ncbi:hypothetical protein DYB37_011400 [Aphanomyces astaci]|uniref:phosphatidate cytidylyltransferase n=1 Tax=Aphanomyces astaci TaxID=112090 RepID=A0A3R7B5E9_APHAT|nr:hypothetical protein DYB35_007652 [Aphanomyces astaci]RHZ29348.1 hypothetical protein DYB37_011400 [Aphanomyces astaci]
MKRRAQPNTLATSPKAGTPTSLKHDASSPLSHKKDANGGVPVGEDIAKPNLSVIKRVVAGFSMIALFGLIIYGGHLYVTLLIVVLQTLIFRELVNVRYRAAAEKNIPWFRSIQLTWTIVTLCLIVFQMRFVLDSICKGLVWLFFPASLVVCNDCFAYFCGKLVGRRVFTTPFLKLSPNKTWEGFLGAFLCTLVFAFWSSALLAQSPWMICPLESIEVQ